MTQEDWDLIYRVHVLGAFRVTKAAWDHMRDAGYGRIIFTASAAGIYGNFGQANYAMAKLGLVGFANTLALEGKKKNVLVNTIAPIAGSRLTETVLPKDITDALKPEYVSPLVAWLCHESCEETGGLFEVGGGLFAKLRWERTEGKLFKLGRADHARAAAEGLERRSPTSRSRRTRPTSPTSMEPILGNLETKSAGGNEFIDVDAALGYEFPPQTSSYDEKDLALYALGVGAGAEPDRRPASSSTSTRTRRTSARCRRSGRAGARAWSSTMAKRGETAPGLNYGFDRILHGEQYTEVKRPLPPHAKLTHKAKIKDIFDKGKGAVVVTAITHATTRTARSSSTTSSPRSCAAPAAGAASAARAPRCNVAPDRKPDAVVEREDHARARRCSTASRAT